MKKVIIATEKTHHMGKLIILLFLLLVLLFLTLSLAACGKSQERITLPETSTIKKITLTHVIAGHESFSTNQNANRKVFLEKEEFAGFKKMLEKSTKKTNKESVNDAPVDVSDYIIVECHLETNNKDTKKDDDDETVDKMFIYKDHNGEAFVEVPYLGIWELDKESCHTIEGLLEQ